MTIKERIRHWWHGDDGELMERPEAKELSDEYLKRFQERVDAEIPKGIKFKTVSRASW